MIGSIFPACHNCGGSWRRREIHKHTWKWALGCVVVVAALVWFVRAQLEAQSFDWSLAASSFARLRWQWLLVGTIPMFGTYYGRALRWAVFLRPLKPKPSMANLLSSTIIGFTAITLFGRPGEFVRPYLIAAKERVPVTSQFAAWVLERIFDLLMALLVFAYALTQVRRSGVQAGEGLAWVLEFGGKIVAVLCVALLVLIVCLRHFAKPMQARLTAALRFLPGHHHERVERLLSTFVQGVESTRSDAALLLVFLYSAVEWLLIAACYWCIARSYQDLLSLTVVDVLIFMGFVSFGAVVQIPGIGGGMQVVAVVVLTELFGVRLELATSFALVTWATTFVQIVPFGLALALKEGLDWGRLRRIGEEISK